jgi:dipeptidase E
MRLYLSSFRMGDHPEHLAALVGSGSPRTVVIANAMDSVPADVRRSCTKQEMTALAELGFDPAELDLRDYFDDEQGLRRDLAGIGLAWLRGGNVFMLRYALHRSAGDAVFRDLLARDALVYGGYSAGPCVLAPSLRGLEIVDDTDAVRQIYGSEPVWDGLGLLSEAFVPHYQTPGHPESPAMEQVVARYRAEGTAYRTLHDGQVLVVNGPDTLLI